MSGSGGHRTRPYEVLSDARTRGQSATSFGFAGVDPTSGAGGGFGGGASAASTSATSSPRKSLVEASAADLAAVSAAATTRAPWWAPTSVEVLQPDPLRRQLSCNKDIPIERIEQCKECKGTEAPTRSRTPARTATAPAPSPPSSALLSA